jgi:hypothetical protein
VRAYPHIEDPVLISLEVGVIDPSVPKILARFQQKHLKKTGLQEAEIGEAVRSMVRDLFALRVTRAETFRSQMIVKAQLLPPA